jgi:hypothetical protein
LKARITKVGGYKCAPEGHTVVTFAEGEVVEGLTAQLAVDDRAAEFVSWASERETKVIAVPEKKHRGRGK